MIIYKDKISGDEMLSDTFKWKEVDDCYFEVEAKMKTETTQIDDKMFGGNASAEGGGEDNEDGAVSGIDVVLANRLVDCTSSFNKVSFRTYIKEYSGKIIAKLQEESPERVKPFKEGMPKLIKRVLKTYDDWQFFHGESNDPDGMVGLLNWYDDEHGGGPYMIFFKDGLELEKV